MKNIVIVGSSGHAKVVIDVIEKEGKYKIIGLIDCHRQSGETTLGYTVIGGIEDLSTIFDKFILDGIFIAIGDNYVRATIVEKIRNIIQQISFVTTIHPTASVAKDVNIGVGTVVMAGAIINTSCEVGDFCILNTNSSLDHDSKMGNYSSLAPSSTTGGGCKIGNYSVLSLGANLIHQTSIGEHTIIGAGSTVIKNIASHCVAYGTPAKVIRKRQVGDKYL